MISRGISAMERRSGTTRLAQAGFVVEYAEIDTDCVILDVRAAAVSAMCQCCGNTSRRTQSRYLRQAADLPIAGRRVVLRVTVVSGVMPSFVPAAFSPSGLAPMFWLRCREGPDALR